jgi:hypothetical protein
MRPLPTESAFTVYSPDPAPRVDSARWAHQARTFLDARVDVLDVMGGPTSDIATIELAVGAPTGATTRMAVRTFPISEALGLVAAAERAVHAIGGAGFDALVARAQRVWQVPREVDGDPRTPLVVAAVIASVLLGPIVPPDELTIFGVKGARVRLQARGWPQSAA